MEIYSVDSVESRENKKNQAATCHSQWELNPGPLSFIFDYCLS